MCGIKALHFELYVIISSRNTTTSIPAPPTFRSIKSRYLQRKTNVFGYCRMERLSCALFCFFEKQIGD